MKFKKSITVDDWNKGKKQLDAVTYRQERYAAKGLIEQQDAMAHFLFYGVIKERSFLISPVTLGLHKLVFAFIGKFKDNKTGCELVIELTLAPIIKNTLYTVYFWLVLGISTGIALSGTKENQQLLLLMFIVCALTGIIWSIIISASIKKQTKNLENIASMFSDMCGDICEIK